MDDDDDEDGVPPLLRDIRCELYRVQTNKSMHGPGTRFAVGVRSLEVTKDGEDEDVGHDKKQADIVRASSDANALTNVDIVRRRVPAVSFSTPSQRFATREPHEQTDGDNLVLHVEKSLKAIEARPRGALSFAKMSSSQIRRPVPSEEENDDAQSSSEDNELSRRRKTHYLDELDVAAAYAQTLPRKAVATLFSCTSRFEKDDWQGRKAKAGGVGNDSDRSTSKAWDESDMTSTIHDADKLLSSRPRIASFSFGTPRSSRGGGGGRDDSCTASQCVRVHTELNPKFDAVRPKPTSCIMAKPKATCGDGRRNGEENAILRRAHSRTTSSPGPGSYEVEPATSKTKGSVEQWKLSSGQTRTQSRHDALREARRSDINPVEAQMRLKKKTPSYTFTPLKAKVPSGTRTRDETLGPRNGTAEVVLEKEEILDDDSSMLPVRRKVPLQIRFELVERRVRGGSWAPSPSCVPGVRAQQAQRQEKAYAMEKEDTKHPSNSSADSNISHSGSDATATTEATKCIGKEVTLPSSSAWTFSRAPRELSKASSNASHGTSEVGGALQHETDFVNVVDISVVRPRSRAVRFSPLLDENDDDNGGATLLCDDDSLFRTLRKIFLKRRRKEAQASSAAEAVDFLDTTSSWLHLQRHVPAPAWSIGAARWRQPRLCEGENGDPQCPDAHKMTDIRERVYELAASIKLTRPSPPVCIINPLPSMATRQQRLHRTQAQHERGLSSSFYDAIDLDVVRPRTAHRSMGGAPSFAKQVGRNHLSQSNTEDGCVYDSGTNAHIFRRIEQQCHADVGSYDPLYAVVEPRVKGTVAYERQQQSRFGDGALVNRETGTNEDPPPIAEGDVLSLDTKSAKDFTLRRLRDPVAAQFVSPSVSALEPRISHPDSSDVRQMFATSVAHGGDSCVRPRIQAAGVVDMKKQSERPVGIVVVNEDNPDSNENGSIVEDRPGTYRAFENWVEMRPSAPAWTFSKGGMREDAPSHGRIREGDILHIDPETALRATSLYTRSVSAHILPEHTHRVRTAVIDSDDTENNGPMLDYYGADKPRKRQPSYVDYSRMLPRPPPVRVSHVDSRIVSCEDENSTTRFEEEAARLSSWPPLATSNTGFTFAKADVSRPLGERDLDLRPELDVSAADTLVRPDHHHGSHRCDTMQPLGLHIGHSDSKELDKDRLTSWVPFLDTDYDVNLKHHVAVHTYTSEHHHPAKATSGFDIDIGGIDAGCYDPSFVHLGGNGGKKVIRWGDGPEMEGDELRTRTHYAKETVGTPKATTTTTSALHKGTVADSPMRMAGEERRKSTHQSDGMTPSRRQKMLQNALARVERQER